MKTYFMFIAAMLYFQDIPAVVKTAFAKSFPNATKVKWEKEKNEYEVSFTDAGKEMSANYSSKGEFLEKEEEIPVASLPEKAKAYLQEHYKNVAVKEAARITKSNGSIQYEAEVNKKDLLFDQNGNILLK